MTTNHAAALQAQLPEVTHRGIHLVYSRSWQLERQIAMQGILEAPGQSARRGPHATATLTLAAAAVIGPLLWLGHELLAMHVH
jgi:hypothetical protein